MIIYKKDIKKVQPKILKKCLYIINHLDTIVSKPLKLDKDIRIIYLNKYRLVYRSSTLKICRLLVHNDYEILLRHLTLEGFLFLLGNQKIVLDQSKQ